MKKGSVVVEQDEYFHNSIFRKYWVKLAGKSNNQLQCNMMYPATEMLIAKYTRQQQYSVRETADIYNKVTKKYIDSLDQSHVEWMHNVLDNKKETELCLFENDHLKLQKDYKFNEGDLKTLYCLAIPKQAREKKLKSIRDLTGEHLPMLKSMV
jgi:m7GpppX diphosphatase